MTPEETARLLLETQEALVDARYRLEHSRAIHTNLRRRTERVYELRLKGCPEHRRDPQGYFEDGWQSALLAAALLLDRDEPPEG